MKNLVKLAVVVVLLTANSMNAQTITEPSATSKTTSVTVENSTLTHSDYRGSMSSSISVKSTNSTYKFRASFDNDLTKRVRTFLQKELRNIKFTNTNNSSFWMQTKNNEKAFECKVREGLVRMYVDKELTSKKFQTEIKEIEEQLKHIINGTSIKITQKERKKEAKRKLEVAKRAYEKAKRDYERAQ